MHKYDGSDTTRSEEDATHTYANISRTAWVWLGPVFQEAEELCVVYKRGIEESCGKLAFQLSTIESSIHARNDPRKV
jgi:hypothetical protein